MEPTYTFQIPTQIFFGRNSSSKLSDILSRTGVKKILIVTDRGVAGAGVIDILLPIIKSAGAETEIFDDVEPNPTVQTVDTAFGLYSDKGCDGVIAVGGGSPMDAGKSVGILATNPGRAADFLGPDKVKNPGATVICIPTTAGTAAEITDVAVLSDHEKKVKTGIRSPKLAPAYAILDPMLTKSLPAEPTRDSGLDALTHAIESFLSVKSWNPTEVLTLEAIELIGNNLRAAVHDGTDIEARENMLKASLMAGLGLLNTGLGLVHAITSPMGGLYDLPHGAGNAIVLPHAMEFMMQEATDKYGRIARALSPNMKECMGNEAAQLAIEYITELMNDVGLPKGLSVYGVRQEDLPGLSKSISKSSLVSLSPRQADAQEILEICTVAL